MRISIAHRITLGVGVIGMMSVLSVVGASSWAMREMSSRLVDARMRATVDLAVIALTDAVITDDIAHIDNLVGRVIDSENGAVRMCVFDQTERLLSTGRCRQIDDIPYPGATVIEKPIVISGTTFGYVGIAYDAEGLIPDLTIIEHRLFFFGAACLLMAVVLTHFIAASVSAELAAMKAAFRSMEEHGGLRPLRKTAVAELNEVADAFNKLVGKAS